MAEKNSWSDFFRTLSGPHVAFLALVAVGGYYLWTEHQAHLFSALPYLILLLCPLMHIFMHHDHGGHRKDDETHKDENH
jgi:hypothetical protein